MKQGRAVAYISFFPLDGLELLPLPFSNILIFHTQNSSSGMLALTFSPEDNRNFAELRAKLERGWKIQKVVNAQVAYEVDQEQDWEYHAQENLVSLNGRIQLIR
ncbi:hypothetical protein LAV78_08020 [Brucella intermedia]|uniref:hypothetical protein n=1 Tax=Brucella intermedia TaxID=94625 RepID=UPI001E4284BF|nr:hypothetical protein [Brucella intermedia]MCB4918466.1 hypothetical protein [Brucella intermedia]